MCSFLILDILHFFTMWENCYVKLRMKYPIAPVLVYHWNLVKRFNLLPTQVWQ